MSTQYQKDDEKGRNIFISYCNQQPWCKVHRTATNPTAKWDVSYFSGSTKMIGEIKKRDKNSDTFDSWYLQEDKWQALIDLKGTSDARITYINHFNDGETMIWDLTDMQMEKTESSIKSLQKNDYTDEKIPKKVYHLFPIDAVIKPKSNEAIKLEKMLDEMIKNNEQEEDNLPF